MTYKKEIIDCLKDMKTISKNNTEIVVKAKFGPSKNIRIPLILDEQLACFIAAIIGDGHLQKEKFQIILDGFDKELIEKFRIICINIFNKEFNINQWIENKKNRYRLTIDSKAIHTIIKNIFEIPTGKKSNIVKIPEFIKDSNKRIKSAFIIGIMVTEGGRRMRGFGLSTSSKQLWEDLIQLFNDIGIEVKKDKWIYKKYNKEYYGISFKKENIHIINKKCKNKEVKNILLECKNFKEGYIS